MINDQFKLRQFLLLLTVTIILIACQEDSVKEENDFQDEDMIAATQLASDYLNSQGARIEETSLSITVLKYTNNKLRYATDTDILGSYQEIDEETITATVQAGGYIFWYSGDGLNDIKGIEFDENSRLKLEEAPRDIFPGKMWLVTILDDPEDDDDLFLKYDIIYNIKGEDGTPIRLDPKIKVAHE